VALTNTQRKKLREALEINVASIDDLDLYVAQDMVDVSLARIAAAICRLATPATH